MHFGISNSWEIHYPDDHSWGQIYLSTFDLFAQAAPAVEPASVPSASSAVADQLAEKQKELEELKRRQMELEIAKAKAQLEQQERELAELRARAMAPLTAPQPAPAATAAPTVVCVLCID